MDPSDDPRVGTLLVGYRIDDLVGRGGMGVVYLAEDLRLKRRVALKLLTPRIAEQEDFRERFLRESELAASLEHPNIVPVYEAGEADGALFLAMRFVEGPSLRRRLHAGRRGHVEALNLLAQVAAALDAAHRQGLVHGDVKPSNILIATGAGTTGEDHVYLADFGLSKRLAQQSDAPEEGLLLATVDYVAPEQIRGDELDGRADVYSLGGVLYECLTGQPPFVRDSDLAVLFAHLEDDPPSARDVDTSLPAGIDGVLAMALAKEPAQRYATCGELVEAARRELGLGARPRSRRRRAIAASLAIAALVAAGLAAFLSVGGDSGEQAATDRLLRVDPATNEVVDSFRVGARASAVTVGDDGNVWVTSRAEQTLTRIDPASGASRVTPVTSGTPLDVAVRDGVAVVATGPFASGFDRIDAASGNSLGTVRLPGADFAQVSVAAGRSGIWLAASGPAGENVGRVTVAPAVSGAGGFERIEIPTAPALLYFLTADSGSYTDVALGEVDVWLARDGGPLLKRIDAATRRVVGSVELPFRPKALAVGDGSVWVTGLFDDLLARVDPVTGKVGLTVRLGAGADGVAFGEGSVWVASSIAGTVTRIDPTTGVVEATIRTGGRPEDIAVGAGGVWVTAHQT